MSNQHGKTDRPWEPQRYRQEAHSPDAKLPESDLAFFLLDTVPRLDWRRFYAPYEDEPRGAPPFDPAMMGCLLLYASCVGVFSSRQSALACERNLACLAIVGPERPDFRTISDFRQQPLEAFTDVFVHVVRLAREAGLVSLGNVSTDGTKLQGHASRPKAMSYGYMHKEVERLREELATLVTAAYQQDEAAEAALGSRRGDERPAALARREDRMAKIEEAMRRLEAQAQAAAEAERARRAEAEAERRRRGQQRRGTVPPPLEETPDDKAQLSFTDPARHIMRTNNKGGDYCGNAQASVDGAYQIIVACDVTDATPDKQQAAPLAQATLALLAQAGIAPPQDAAGNVLLIPRPWIRAITAREPGRRWRTAGLTPTEPRGASSTTSRPPRRAPHPPRRRSAWQRKCAPRQGGRCTPDARSSPSQSWARSKQRGGSVASCCADCSTSVVNGVSCA